MADNLLVNRDGQTYQVDMENTKAIQDTDLLLVNRNGTTYTVAGSEISRGKFSEVVITPTSIVPEISEQLLTAVTDIPKVGNNIPADVIWNWYQYDNATGDAGKTLLKTLINRENFDTLVLPASSANKYIGCSVEYLAVTIDETGRCSVGQPLGPVAVMNGLRFDSGRTTYLNRTPGVEGNRKTWTWSGWVKRSGLGTNQSLIEARNSDIDRGSIYFNASNQLEFAQHSTVWRKTNQVFTDTSKWNHIVVAFDTDQMTASDRVKIFVNGEKVESFASSTDPNQGGSYAINSSAYHVLGGSNYGGNVSDGIVDGYLSDVYFVDGKPLKPTAFGKQFAEGWGPLDSTQVKANINTLITDREQPYDSRANTDQVWSDNFTGTWTIPVTSAFDGILSTTGAYTDGGSGTINFTGLTSVDSLRVYGNAATDLSYWVVTTDKGTFNPKWSTQGAQWATIPVSPGSTLQSIAAANGEGQLRAVEVNGRLLVDQGVWNNSQNWSDYATATNGFRSDQPAALMFNGSYADGAMTASNDAGASVEVDLSSFSLSVTGKLVLRIARHDQMNIFINKDNNPAGFTGIDAGTVGRIEIQGMAGQPLNHIKVVTKTAGTQANLGYIEVDGTVLVDQGAQWNTSQVWSDKLTSDSGWVDPAINGFDGNSDTHFRTGNTTGNDKLRITFTGPIEVKEYIKVYYTDSTIGSFYFKIDGSTSPSVQGGPCQLDYVGTVDSTTPLEFYSSADQGVSVRVSRIEVDGEILVDAYGPGFGDNGFYLPFDPTATGVNYTQGVTANAPSGTTGAPSNIFNGDTSNRFGCNNNLTNLPYIDVQFDSAIDAQTSLEIYADGDGSSSYAVSVNGGSDIPITNSLDYKNLGSFASVSSIRLKQTGGRDGGGTGFSLYAIRVNGKILVDHSSIGVDASGNENNFHDQNFVTADNSDRSQVWSENLFATDINGDEVDFSADSPASFAFDSSASTAARVDIPSTYFTYEFRRSFTNVTSLEIAVGAHSGNQSITVDVDGEITTFSQPDSFPIPYSNIKIPSSGSFNVIKIKQTTESGGSAALNLAAIKVNGEILVDKNIPVDTVTDTPLRNYAVIESGSNGNLVGSGALTYTGESGKSYYYETDGGAVTSPAPVGDAANGTHNFGQQPFVSPRITSQDLTAGTVTLADEKFDGSQEWSAGTGIDAPSTGSIVNMYDGSFATNALYSPGTVRIFAGPSITANSSLEIAWSSGSAPSVSVNGGAEITTPNGGGTGAYYTVPGFKGSINTIDVSFGSNSNVFGIRVDGKLLIDSSIYDTWNTSQNWSNNITTNSSQPITRLTNGNARTSYSSSTDMDNNAVILNKTTGYIRLDSEIDVTNTISVLSRNWNRDGNQENYVVKVGESELGEFISTTANGTEAEWTDFNYTGKIEATNILEINSSNSVKDGESRILAIRIDGEILVDSGAGTFGTLYQTWSQYIISTLRLGLAEADALKAMLLDHAQTYDAAEDYCEGSVIQAFGELWIAVNEAPATTFADLPALMSHPNWERLNISAN
jgi:hypothetical protein